MTSVQVQHQTAIDIQTYVPSATSRAIQIQTSVQVQHLKQHRFRLLCKCSINSNTDSDFRASAASTAIQIQTSVQVQHQQQHRFRLLCKCSINSNTDSDFCASAASTAIQVQTSVQVQHQQQYRFRHLCKCSIKEQMSSPRRFYRSRRFSPGTQIPTSMLKLEAGTMIAYIPKVKTKTYWQKLSRL